MPITQMAEKHMKRHRNRFALGGQHMVDEPDKTGYNISTYSDVWQIYAPVMELVDMRDLGSRAFGVWVRVPSGAP